MTSKKLNLDILFRKEMDSEPSRNRTPNGTPVSCEECGWSDMIEDCQTEIESEGWEYPSYEVLVCPKCGGCTNI